MNNKFPKIKAYFSLLVLTSNAFFFFYFSFSVASTEDSPIANKLKRIWFKTPIGEEQATQAVLDPVVGKLFAKTYRKKSVFLIFPFY